MLIADAVTVVLYTMMVVFAGMEGNVGGEQYALGIVSFFTISLGGLAIGILCGLLTALITRTTSDVRGKCLVTYHTRGRHSAPLHPNGSLWAFKKE